MRITLGLGLGARQSLPGVPPVPAAPVNTVAPSIVGTPVVGGTLTFSPGSWTGYPSPSFAYQLKRDGVDIAGASPYTVLPADYETDLTLVVVGTNTEGSDSGTSIAVTVAGIAPLIDGVPSVSGTPVVGSELTLTAASVSGYPAPTSTWQLIRDGVDVGAPFSGGTYTLVTADGETDVSFRQIETNALGFDDATSAAVVVEAADPSGTPIGALMFAGGRLVLSGGTLVF